MAGKTLVDPKPWWQVGLAILPGVVTFLETSLHNLGWQVRLPWPVALSVFILLLLSSIIWAVARRRYLDIGAWGWVPLGLLAVLGVSAVSIPLTSLLPRPLGALLLLLLEVGLLVVALFVFLRCMSFVRMLPAIGGALAPALAVLLLFACIGWVGWGGIEVYTPGQPVVLLMDWSGLELYANLFLLVVLGVLPAVRHGLVPGLFVLPGGVFLMAWHIGHWFRWVGTFQAAVHCILKMPHSDNPVSRIPNATAGTCLVVKCDRTKL